MKLVQKFSIVLLILWMASCNKSLDVSPTSVITTNSFWKTADDARGGLYGMYVDFRSNSEAIFLTGDQRSEIYEGGVYGGGTYTLFNNAMTPDQPGHPSWVGYYRTINSANLILKYVPSINFSSESEKNRILAEAYAVRAFLYFTMSKTWGDLIIRTEPIESASAEVTIQQRSSKEAVFALIKDDIENALSLFPDNSFRDQRGAWSKPAVNALKADVYLWTSKTMGGGEDDARTALAATESIESADVSLLPVFGDIFDYNNKGNNEILMSIRHTELEGGNYFWHMWIIGSAVPSNISDEARSLLLPVGGGQGLMVTTKLVRDQFVADDKRRGSTFFEIYTYDNAEDSTYYTNVALKGQGVVVGGNRIFASDVVLYRYADVILMRAEAKNALGQDPSVEINQVRQRAYGDEFEDYRFVSGTKEDNDAAILKERLLELTHEGKRWWDLLRFDKAFDIVPTLRTQSDKQYLKLFPIATSVLSLEPQVEQNPGYTISN